MKKIIAVLLFVALICAPVVAKEQAFFPKASLGFKMYYTQQKGFTLDNLSASVGFKALAGDRVTIDADASYLFDLDEEADDEGLTAKLGTTIAFAHNNDLTLAASLYCPANGLDFSLKSLTGTVEYAQGFEYTQLYLKGGYTYSFESDPTVSGVLFDSKFDFHPTDVTSMIFAASGMVHMIDGEFYMEDVLPYYEISTDLSDSVTLTEKLSYTYSYENGIEVNGAYLKSDICYFGNTTVLDGHFTVSLHGDYSGLYPEINNGGASLLFLDFAGDKDQFTHSFNLAADYNYAFDNDPEDNGVAVSGLYFFGDVLSSQESMAVQIKGNAKFYDKHYEVHADASIMAQYLSADPYDVKTKSSVAFAGGLGGEMDCYDGDFDFSVGVLTELDIYKINYNTFNFDFDGDFMIEIQ